MAPTPSQCQQIADRVDTLRATLADLEEAIATEPEADVRARLRERAFTVGGQLNTARDQLQRCIEANPPPPLLATFTGRATLKIEHPLTPDAFVANIIAPLEFGSGEKGYRVIRSLSLPSLPSRTFTTPFGDCTTSIRLQPMPAQLATPTSLATPEGFLGYFVPNALPARTPLPWRRDGVIFDFELPAGYVAELVLFGKVDHSLSLGDWFDVDSSFRWDLDVDQSSGGSPMDTNGAIVLSTFRESFGNGVLAGRRCSLRIEGVVSPHP